MADNNHPITPPPELVAQIRSDALHRSDGQLDYELRLIHAGYCAGADQELEACCEWLVKNFWLEPRGKSITNLRAARRPTPPSEAEVALEALSKIDGYAVGQMSAYAVYGELRQGVTTIRQALERLKELEKRQ